MALPEPFELEYLHELERFEEEKQMTYITSAERIGIQKGIQLGLEQGLEQGLLQGEKAVLLRLLERKFGDVPAAYRDRIAQAQSSHDLLEWADVLIAANTLAEIFE